ncbi:transcription elongation factor GreA [Candidatus Falkowbacteria bacterium CG10_big_fil_rev_8_21_14_0_10_37_6]|uniref:Transcription elongation factor GreA n=1 Tax=Candidatus Falkowbacteria bacterium CG10_big_fil_rev_8_21_14_0_10_37_6 TaxID=1974563 RepID=A0A2H0V6R5_9BACT|nr:MAG: transcription elongation factor GreA [Candidatus Falkowbacteria bacterium CG10_big_fil_rev_8_21_14_0_10_37_6]
MRLPTRRSEKDNLQPVDLHITQKKYDEISEKFIRLKKSRPRLADEVKRLAEMGDFSENAAYQIAKGKLRGLNRHMAEAEYMLNHAVIIAPQQNGLVELGSNVVVEINGKRKTYQILGSTETDPLSGVISHNSPIGAALLGKRAGEIAQVKLKDKIIEYQIIEIT